MARGELSQRDLVIATFLQGFLHGGEDLLETHDVLQNSHLDAGQVSQKTFTHQELIRWHLTLTSV